MSINTISNQGSNEDSTGSQAAMVALGVGSGLLLTGGTVVAYRCLSKTDGANTKTRIDSGDTIQPPSQSRPRRADNAGASTSKPQQSSHTRTEHDEHPTHHDASASNSSTATGADRAHQTPPAEPTHEKIFAGDGPFQAALRNVATLDRMSLENMLKKSLASEALGQGKDARAYRIPGHPELVLRSNLDFECVFEANVQLPHMVFVPIHYSAALEGIPGDTSLGFARGVLVTENHPFAKRPNISPKEALPDSFMKTAHTLSLEERRAKLSETIPFWVLPNCSGSHPGHQYKAAGMALRDGNESREELVDRMAARKKAMPQEQSSGGAVPPLTFQLTEQAREIYETFRSRSRIGLPEWAKSHEERIAYRLHQENNCENFFANCEAGAFVTGQEDGYIREKAFFPESQKLFIDRYNNYVRKYKESIAEIAVLPQSSFDKIVKTLGQLDLAHQEVHVDFEHSANITIDAETREFRLLDPAFHPEKIERTRPGDLDRFAQVLIGNETYNGWRFIARRKDIAELTPQIQRIIDKIDKAAKKNSIPWRYANPFTTDELSHRFKIKLPERLPFI